MQSLLRASLAYQGSLSYSLVLSNQLLLKMQGLYFKSKHFQQSYHADSLSKNDITRLRIIMLHSLLLNKIHCYCQVY